MPAPVSPRLVCLRLDPPTAEFDDEVGLDRLVVVYAHDAKVELGSGLEVPGASKKRPDKENLGRLKDIRTRLNVPICQFLVATCGYSKYDCTKRTISVLDRRKVIMADSKAAKLSLRKAAAKLGIHHATLSRAVKRGEVTPEFVTPGGYMRFTESQI